MVKKKDANGVKKEEEMSEDSDEPAFTKEEPNLFTFDWVPLDGHSPCADKYSVDGSASQFLANRG